MATHAIRHAALATMQYYLHLSPISPNNSMWCGHAIQYGEPIFSPPSICQAGQHDQSSNGKKVFTQVFTQVLNTQVSLFKQHFAHVCVTNSALRASLISTVFENSNPNKYSTNYQQNVLYWSVFRRWKSVKSCPHGKRVNVAHTVILTRLQFWCHCAKLEVILSSTTIGKKIEVYFFWNVQFLTSLSNNWMGTKEKSLKNVWDFTGRAQGVGLIGWINSKPLVCLASSARSANAPGRAQSFLFGEFFQK